MGDLLEVLAGELASVSPSVEVVVCDNASEDETRQVVQGFEERINMRYVQREENVGAALNVLNLPDFASGRYCWILGDDDLLFEGVIPNLLGILETQAEPRSVVIGYSYESRDDRCDVLRIGVSRSGGRPVFSDVSVDREVSSWEETFHFSNTPALHTSIVSCIFPREDWVRCRERFMPDLKSPTLGSLESTFPHTVLWARMFVGKPVYFYSRPTVHFFVGEQDWFESKWNTILFSYCLQLGKLYRSLGAEETSIRHYENIIFHKGHIETQIVNQTPYSKERFSLDWLICEYGRYPEFWDCLGRGMRRSKGIKNRLKVAAGIGKALVRMPSYWIDGIRLYGDESWRLLSRVGRKLVG